MTGSQPRVYRQPINPTTRPGSFYLKQHELETFALSTLSIQTNKGHTSLCQSSCHQILHPATIPLQPIPPYGHTEISLFFQKGSLLDDFALEDR